MRNNKSILSHEEIRNFLMLQDPKDLDELFARARQARKDHYGNKVFLYGFVYFSTFCRNSCSFCYYRNTNSISRYRKDSKEILEHSIKLAESGVNLIDLTMGEDLQYRASNFKGVCNLIDIIKRETGLPVMISPGIANKKGISSFAKAGADFYALYQETFNKQLFKSLRLSQSFDERMKSKTLAIKYKMLVEEGILTGVGETINDIADSIIKMGEGGATQLRVMTFVPQEGIPLNEIPNQDPRMEEKIIAVLRIAYPNSLIPASLDIDGIKGLKLRLQAGANIVTSIIPPMSGLQGVAQSIMDVDEGGRTVPEVTEILTELGMEKGSNEEFQVLINSFKQGL